MARRGTTRSTGEASDTISIKKYANRRLYNTAESSYVTLDDLARMVQEGVEFTVRDAKTGEDITRSVLTQIIVEQEAKGNNLLPTGFLRQLISFYGDNLQGLVPQYLEATIQAFAHNQEQMRSYLENALGGIYPFSSLEEMSRKNMAMFEQAMSMMTPFRPGAEEPEMAAGEASGKPKEPAEGGEALDALKAQLEAMQRQLDELSSRKRD